MEQEQQPSKWLVNSAYSKIITVILLFLFVIFSLGFSGLSPTLEKVPEFFTDFHAFYIAGEMVQQGNYADAYHFNSFLAAQRHLTSSPCFMPWTYPPQFGLVVGLLPFFSVGVAYCLFSLLWLSSFLITFKQLAGKYWAVILLIGLPALFINFLCGQNGFLTGFLIALFCLLLPRQPRLAGLPLGVMCIKPHLIIGIAIYLVLRKQWQTLLVAGLTVGLTAAIATVIFGWAVWPAFGGGLKEMSGFMRDSMYPFYRMTSAYALVRSIGVEHHLAVVAQFVSAMVAMILILLVLKDRQRSERERLGFVMVLTPLFSPYIYDYDQLILLVGLALLVPSFAQRVSYFVPVSISVFFFTAMGLIAQMGWVSARAVMQGEFFAPSALFLWITVAILWFGINAGRRQSAAMSTSIAA